MNFKQDRLKKERKKHPTPKYLIVKTTTPEEKDIESS